MIELRFRVRNSIFVSPGSNVSRVVRPITFRCETLEEASLLGEVDQYGRLLPNAQAFHLTFPRKGPVIEAFRDCALGEFVKAQVEALAQNGEPPARCEVQGLDPFLDPENPENAERTRDLISVCEFRAHEFTPESAVRFLKDSGFFDEYIIIGVKRGNGWRRSRCITTFEGRPGDAATILGHLAEYFGQTQGDNKPHDDHRQ